MFNIPSTIDYVSDTYIITACTHKLKLVLQSICRWLLCWLVNRVRSSSCPSSSSLIAFYTCSLSHSLCNFRLLSGMYDLFRGLYWLCTCSVRQLVLITGIRGVHHNTPEVRFYVLIGYSNLPLDFCCEAFVIAADIRCVPDACIICNRSSPSATNARNVRLSVCVIYSGNNVTISMYKPQQLFYWSTISREVRGSPSLCHVGCSSGWMHLGP